MALNETLCGVIASQDITIPSLIIQYVLFLITMLIIGLTVVKNSRHKFMVIWGLTAIFSAVILIGLCLMPNLVLQITSFFKGLS